MKHLEDKEVYLIPTGNNARYNSGKYYKAKILKVAKVNITFIKEGGFEQKSRFNGNQIGNGNSGYEVHETEQGVKDYILSVELSKKIYAKFYCSGSYQVLNIEILKQVAELLKI